MINPFVMLRDQSRPRTQKDSMNHPAIFRRNEPVFRARLEIDENSHNILTDLTLLEQRASILPFITLFGLW